MFIRKPRIKNTRAMVLAPHLIRRLGFGENQESRVVDGVYMTEHVTRCYRLVCGCIVSSPEECGDACYFCRLEIESALASLNHHVPVQGMPTPEEIYYSSLCCRHHTYKCVVPFCSRSVCPRHAGMLPDGTVLCMDHFQNYELALTIQDQGPVRYGVKKFIASLFRMKT